MKLSLIIPVLDEESTLAEVIGRVAAAETPGWDKEVIVVNDGSRDGTAALLESLRSEYQLKIITHPRNLGKGAALRSGFTEASGEAVLVQDADLEYDPSDYSVLLAALDPGTDAVYGIRALNPKGRGYWPYILGAKILDIVLNILYQAKLRDTYTCYKLVKLSALKKFELQSNGFEIEAELTAKLLLTKARIAEVPIHYYPRTFREGKHIRPKDGLKGLWTLLRWRFSKT